MLGVLKLQTLLKRRQSSQLTRMASGQQNLYTFCNSVTDNPFMAGAYCGVNEPEAALNVGVSGPGVVRWAIENMPKTADLGE